MVQNMSFRARAGVRLKGGWGGQVRGEGS